MCGFPSYDISRKICGLNYILIIIAYAIFKENSRCKFDMKSYKDSNLSNIVKENLKYYDMLLQHKGDKCINIMLNSKIYL